MTVRELMALLANLDGDLPVILAHPDSGHPWGDVQFAEFVEHDSDGRADNFVLLSVDQ